MKTIINQLKNHKDFYRYFKNTGWMFFGQIFSLLISFFVSAWLARYLGPENYGNLNYTIAFAWLFAFIANLGIDGILNRELIIHPEERDKLLGTAFKLKLFGGIFTFIIITIAVIFFESSLLIKSLVILYSLIFILQAINVIVIFFQAEVKAKKNVLIVLITTIISSIFKIFIILLNQGIIWLILIFVFEVAFQGLCLINVYRRDSLKISAWYFDWDLAKKILSGSWLLMLASASGYVCMKIDQVMIGNFLDKNAVGLYAVAVKFSEIWYFIPSIICCSLFPAILNGKKISAIIYKERFKKIYILLASIAVLIAISSTVLAPWIINLLFGHEYLASTNILKIYIWSSIGMFISIAINQYFLSENQLRAIFYFNFFPMLINIGLNLILIPRIGSIGAAWTTLISYSIGPLTLLGITIIKRTKQTN